MNDEPADTAAISFQTPESELRTRLGERHPPNSLIAGGIEELLTRQVATAPWDLSVTVLPEGADRGARSAAAGKHLRDLLILRESLGEPLDAVMTSRREEAGFVVEEVVFTGTPPLRIPATVVIPRNGATRHPAIVALHSMGGMRAYGREKLLAFSGQPAFLADYRKTYYEGRSLQLELARRGYLSIAIDACGFGERTLTALSDLEKFRHERLRFSAEDARSVSLQAAIVDENLIQRALLTSGISLAALVATDDLRTVDYLCSREDVDSARIGCVGLSFGSFRSNYLAALDDRIRAAVSVCWISTLAGILNYNIAGAMGFFALPPSLYQRMDLADIVAVAAPKPFLAISGWQDLHMQPFGMAEAHLRLRKVWDDLGASDALGSLIYDCGHEFNATMQKAAWAFFDRHLEGIQ